LTSGCGSVRRRQSVCPDMGARTTTTPPVQNFVAGNNGANGVPVGLAQNSVPTGGRLHRHRDHLPVTRKTICYVGAYRLDRGAPRSRSVP
jgi:hypothetical protein